MRIHFNLAVRAGAAITAGLVLLVGALGAAAQESTERSVPETFTATTANMDPEGTDLRINVLRWSGDDDRRAVLDVLTDPENAATDDGDLDALIELPTLGYVWPDGSALGYSIKYAVREAASGGGERLTFVTGRRLGRFAREPGRRPGRRTTPCSRSRSSAAPGRGRRRRGHAVPGLRRGVRRGE